MEVSDFRFCEDLCTLTPGRSHANPPTRAKPVAHVISKALVCTDLSTESHQLVGCAGQLKVLGLKEVVLTHVVDLFGSRDDSRLLDRPTEAAFRQQVDFLEHAGFTVRVETPLGSPGFSVAEVSRAHSAELIVVGTRGTGLFPTPFSGSVCSDVASVCDVPVLIAPNGVFASGGPELVCQRILGHVMFATDFSTSASFAFDWLLRMIAKGLRRVTLVHVQDVDRIRKESPGRLAEFDAEDMGRLEGLRDMLRRAGVESAVATLRHGSPTVELTQIAKECGCTMVVMGRKGRTPSHEAFLGGVSDTMIRWAPAPVLLVPQVPAYPV